MGKFSRPFKKISQLKPAGFWSGFVAGLFYFGWIFWWFWSLPAAISFEVSRPVLVFLAISLPFTVSVATMSVFWGMFSCVVSGQFRKNGFRGKEGFLPLIFASAFTLSEYVRSWFFSIIWFGDGGLIGAHWTLGNIAYLFADIDLIRQSSSFWGIYGVEFFIVFLAAGFYFLFRPGSANRIKLFTQIIAVVILLILAGLYQSPLKSSLGRSVVSAVQTDNPSKPFYEAEELLEDFGKKIELLKEASANSDIIIFPENTDFSKRLSQFQPPAGVQKFFSELSPNNILVIDSNRIEEEKGVRSRSFLISSQDGPADFYDKRLLTPAGETNPYLIRPLLWFVRYFSDSPVPTMWGVSAKGANNDNILSYKNSGIKTLACSDAISPKLSGGDNYGFIAIQNNMGVFNGNKNIENQFLSIARFRAAENGRFAVIASNFGRSAVIDGRGNIVKKADSSGYQILTGGIVLNNTRTWYNKLGDWPVLLVSLVIFGFGAINANKDKTFS